MMHQPTSETMITSTTPKLTRGANAVRSSTSAANAARNVVIAHIKFALLNARQRKIEELKNNILR
jgi:hypothetical protein